MAVFTHVDAAQLRPWLAQFSVGEFVALQGISSGIENSNFFLNTTQGEFVLTLFERLAPNELPFYLQLMQHLAQRNLPVPLPQATRQGALFATLNGKPAAIVTKLQGEFVPKPSDAECAQLGRTLAHMHLAVADFSLQQPNLRGLEWWVKTVPQVLPHVPAALGQRLQNELNFLQQQYASAIYAELPQGAVHADLFRNNSMFYQGQLSGVFDFYFAGCDALLFDVAVCVNDWCMAVNEISAASAKKATCALLEAYAAVRPFSAAEKTLWPVMLRAAAFRFWLSRLWDFYLPRAAEMLTPHDPTHFEKILYLRQTTLEELP